MKFNQKLFNEKLKEKPALREVLDNINQKISFLECEIGRSWWDTLGKETLCDKRDALYEEVKQLAKSGINPKEIYQSQVYKDHCAICELIDSKMIEIKNLIKHRRALKTAFMQNVTE